MLVNDYHFSNNKNHKGTTGSMELHNNPVALAMKVSSKNRCQAMQGNDDLYDCPRLIDWKHLEPDCCSYFNGVLAYFY